MSVHTGTDPKDVPLITAISVPLEDQDCNDILVLQHVRLAWAEMQKALPPAGQTEFVEITIARHHAQRCGVTKSDGGTDNLDILLHVVTTILES